MNGTMVVISPEGQVEKHELNRPVSVREITDAAGGRVARIRTFRTYEDQPCVAFQCKYGEADGLPSNVLAREAWEACPTHPGHRIFLHGHVVILTGDHVFLRRV